MNTLKKIVLHIGVAITLLAASSFVFAKWEEIGRTTGATLYVDPSSITRNGDFAAIYYLENRDTPDRISGKDVKAIATYYQFNCVSEQFRTIGYSFYSGPMGSGYQLFKSDKVSEWKVASGAFAFVRKIACGMIVKK